MIGWSALGAIVGAILLFWDMHDRLKDIEKKLEGRENRVIHRVTRHARRHTDRP